MLGDLLRETRESKNLTLNDIENGTNIRKLYIKCIEDGDYKRLPGEVFLKGFIKSYGKFLGLDSAELINMYESEKKGGIVKDDTTAPKSQPQTSKAKTPTNTASKQVNPSLQARNKATATSSATTKPAGDTTTTNASKTTKNAKLTVSLGDLQDKTPSNKPKKTLFLLIVIFCIAIIGYGGYSLVSTDKTTTPEPTSSQPVEITTPEVQTASKSSQEIVLNVHFTRDCWTEVSIDGEDTVAKTIKKGSDMTWKGTKNIAVMFANASAVQVTLNGKKLDKVGEPGSIVEKTFLPDGKIK